MKCSIYSDIGLISLKSIVLIIFSWYYKSSFGRIYPNKKVSKGRCWIKQKYLTYQFKITVSRGVTLKKLDFAVRAGTTHPPYPVTKESDTGEFICKCNTWNMSSMKSIKHRPHINIWVIFLSMRELQYTIHGKLSQCVLS